MRRLVEQWVPLLGAICGVLVAVVGIPILVHPLWASLAVLGGILGLSAAAAEYQRRIRLENLLEFAPTRKVGLTAREFGAKHSEIASKLFQDSEPPYIPREEEDRLLDQAFGIKRFVVVKGVTSAGKTRAAFEAIGRVLDRAEIVMPNEPNPDRAGSRLM